MKWVLGLSIILMMLAACSTPPTTSPPADMPNPASAYCVEQGFQSEIRTAAGGSQSGVCIFPDGSECDEWAYFRGECAPALHATETAVIPTPTEAAIEQSVSTPAGAIIDPRNGSMDFTQGLSFYNTDGLILGELLAPRGREVHVAGHYQGSLQLPLVFHAHELESKKPSLNLNSGSTPTEPGGQVSLLVPLEDKAMLSGLVGAPGEPLIFFVVFQPTGHENLQSQVFLGSIDSLATLTPILTLNSNESRYWKPVAIATQDRQPKGLWFTRHPWGIGGVCAFRPNEGLSYVDLVTKLISEVLLPEAQFTSLSPDQVWAAYSLQNGTRYELFIQNLATDQMTALPSLPEYDHGAGDGIFSPSNKYIAWREVQGCQFDENFHQTIRIALLDGQVIGDYKDIAFYKTAGSERGNWIEPMGWLTEESLLVQVIALEKPHNGTVVKLNVTTGEISLFAQGFFAGWFYP